LYTWEPGGGRTIVCAENGHADGVAKILTRLFLL
jgi:hypothetical protein